MNHKQKDWPEWLVTAEFTVNNKTHLATKVSLFRTNCNRELRIEVNIRRKRKVEKIIELAKRMKKVQKEAEVQSSERNKVVDKQKEKRSQKIEER